MSETMEPDAFVPTTEARSSPLDISGCYRDWFISNTVISSFFHTLLRIFGLKYYSAHLVDTICLFSSIFFFTTFPVKFCLRNSCIILMILLISFLWQWEIENLELQIGVTFRASYHPFQSRKSSALLLLWKCTLQLRAFTEWFR